jgi:hypothetical protein
MQIDRLHLETYITKTSGSARQATSISIELLILDSTGESALEYGRPEIVRVVGEIADATSISK